MEYEEIKVLGHEHIYNGDHGAPFDVVRFDWNTPDEHREMVAVVFRNPNGATCEFVALFDWGQLSRGILFNTHHFCAAVVAEELRRQIDLREEEPPTVTEPPAARPFQVGDRVRFLSGTLKQKGKVVAVTPDASVQVRCGPKGHRWYVWLDADALTLRPPKAEPEDNLPPQEVPAVGDIVSYLGAQGEVETLIDAGFAIRFLKPQATYGCRVPYSADYKIVRRAAGAKWPQDGDKVKVQGWIGTVTDSNRAQGWFTVRQGDMRQNVKALETYEIVEYADAPAD